MAVCDFTGVPPGTEAVTVLDDSNINGKIDFDFIGLPTKGYGFSNDVKATLTPSGFAVFIFGIGERIFEASRKAGTLRGGVDHVITQCNPRPRSRLVLLITLVISIYLSFGN